MGRQSQVRTLTPNFTIVTFKSALTAPKIAKIGNFWYNFGQKGPLQRLFFTTFGLGTESQVRILMPNFTVMALKNVGLQPPKSQKNGNFLYKFAPKGKFWGSTEKVEYRCTITNLLVCNDTIIVLNIILLHSVSVITSSSFQSVTNKKQAKNITLFRLQPALDPRSLPRLAW